MSPPPRPARAGLARAGLARAGLARLAAIVVLVTAALAAAAPAALAAPASSASSAGSAGSAHRVAVAGPAAPALPAHAALASTQPADGTVVASAPRQVSASFDEQVGITADSLVVYSPSGQRADDGQTIHVSAYEIAVGLLPGLGDGTYTAVWHVISADTHPVEGAFTFSVGAPSATHVGALEPASDVMVGSLFAVVRWLEYLCYALLGGGAAFLILCWPEGGARRGVSRLITASALGLFASTLLGLLLQGPYSAGTGLNQLFDGALVSSTFAGRLGPASEARAMMALLAAWVAGFLLPRLPAAAPGFRRAAAAVWAVLTTAMAATWAVYDHASTGVQSPWGIPADIVHLDAVAAWIGGLAVLAGFALRSPGTQSPGAESPGTAAVAVTRAVRRFSAVALGCVAIIVASGAYQTWREVGAWNALFVTGYGRLILAKVAGLLILIILGYLARRLIGRGQRTAVRPRSGPRLLVRTPAGVTGTGVTGTVVTGTVDTGTRDTAAPGGPDTAWQPVLRRLRRSVGAELAVAAVILACTALLVNTATGREAYAPTLTASQPFNTGGPGGAGIVHVFAAPARLGPNTVQVYFTAASGRGFVPAQVTAALYFPARNLGPLPVTLTRTAPGQYKTDSATATFTGQWTLQIVVRSDAFDETSVTFPLAIR